MPSPRSAISANGKRKAKADVSSDEEYRPSNTLKKSRKRRKVVPSTATPSGADKMLQIDDTVKAPTSTVIVELPTKALEDVLKKGVTKVTQKSIRDIIAMIYAQKALITSQAPVADDFIIIAHREGWEWSGHFRVRGVHKLYELAKVVAAASGTDIQGMSLTPNTEDKTYSVGDEEHAEHTLKEASLVLWFQIWQ